MKVFIIIVILVLLVIFTKRNPGVGSSGRRPPRRPDMRDQHRPPMDNRPPMGNRQVGGHHESVGARRVSNGGNREPANVHRGTTSGHRESRGR
jgi:hypothetical protein